jgi:hypothetical protein
MRPGLWNVGIFRADLPRHISERHELAANATLDLGRIDLVVGGTAIVNVIGAPAGETPSFRVRARDSRSFFAAQWVSDRRLRTSVLAPGTYELQLRCDGCALRWIPFEIRAGEETSVEATLTRGVRQRLEFVRADGRRLSAEIVHSLRTRDQVLFERNFVYFNRPTVHAADGALQAELWLVPGDYRLEAAEGDLSGKAQLTVTETEGAPARIVLR